MRNAQAELLELTKSYKLNILAWNIYVRSKDDNVIHSLLQQDYTEEDFIRESSSLNVEYDARSGNQYLAGCVLLENDHWLSREERDGAEKWVLNHAPDICIFETKKYIPGNNYIDTLYKIISEEERFHELHLTVELIDDVEKFKRDCKEINVKPIILALQASNKVIRDVMTSYTRKCTYSHMQDIYYQQCSYFEKKGYKIVRFKIETTGDANTLIYTDSYFESHIHLHIEKDFKMYKLQQVCKDLDVHLSRNVFKETETYDVIMATLRTYDKLDVFKTKLTNVVKTLSEFVTVGEHHIEYAIYDDNVQHDRAWLE